MIAAACGAGEGHPAAKPSSGEVATTSAVSQTPPPSAAPAPSAPQPKSGTSSPDPPSQKPCESAGTPVDIEDLASVIRHQISPAALGCYKRSLAHAPGQSGQLVLSIRVTATGGVEDVTIVKNAGLNAEVSECVAGIARSAGFPCNPGGLVNVPFTFQVSKSGADAGP
jgi:outer membrane biosynthesis protein TonB